MCDVCVMNAVKDRMLSRRDFFRASAAVTATAAVGGLVAAPAAMAAGHGGVVDMSHKLEEAFPTFFGVPGFKTHAALTLPERKSKESHETEHCSGRGH